MKEIAAWALDTAKARGASYADVRVVDLRQRYLSTKNGQPAQVRQSQSMGVGVRVVAEGAWGFAATDDLTRSSVDRVAAHAVEIARASASAKKHDVRLAKEPKVIDRWEAPCRIDPFSIPVSMCLELMLEVDRELRRVKGVTLAEACMDFRRIEQLFLSTAGSEIAQVKTQTGAGSSPPPSPKVKFNGVPTRILSGASTRRGDMNSWGNWTWWEMHRALPKKR